MDAMITRRIGVFQMRSGVCFVGNGGCSGGLALASLLVPPVAIYAGLEIYNSSYSEAHLGSERLILAVTGKIDSLSTEYVDTNPL